LANTLGFAAMVSKPGSAARLPSTCPMATPLPVNPSVVRRFDRIPLGPVEASSASAGPEMFNTEKEPRIAARTSRVTPQ
jgi:hypothetical protein